MINFEEFQKLFLEKIIKTQVFDNDDKDYIYKIIDGIFLNKETLLSLHNGAIIKLQENKETFLFLLQDFDKNIEKDESNTILNYCILLSISCFFNSNCIDLHKDLNVYSITKNT